MRDHQHPDQARTSISYVCRRTSWLLWLPRKIRERERASLMLHSTSTLAWRRDKMRDSTLALVEAGRQLHQTRGCLGGLGSKLQPPKLGNVLSRFLQNLMNDIKKKINNKTAELLELLSLWMPTWHLVRRKISVFKDMVAPPLLLVFHSDSDFFLFKNISTKNTKKSSVPPFLPSH